MKRYQITVPQERIVAGQVESGDGSFAYGFICARGALGDITLEKGPGEYWGPFREDYILRLDKRALRVVRSIPGVKISKISRRG